MTARLFELLAQDLTAAVLVWRLDRADGVALGFTGHDHDLSHGGLRFRADHGMNVSAIVARSALDDDGISLSGPLSAAGIFAQDIWYGRWADARVSVDLMDWTLPESGTVALFRGVLTGISVQGGAGGRFALEAQRELALRANRSALRAAPMCRAELGDRQCGVDLDPRTRIGLVTGVVGKRLILAEVPGDPHDFSGGHVRFLSGAHAGFDTVIETADATGLVVGALPPDVAVGTRVRIRHGCDKRFDTCAARFGNAAAFAGEPHLPGRDTLVRYGAP